MCIMANVTSFGVHVGAVKEPPPSPLVTIITTPGPSVPELVIEHQVETPEPKKWTQEEAEVLAKMLWGEARGIKSDAEKAACVWCVLNRVDAFGKSIVEVTTAPHQFSGYSMSNPIDPELYDLCEDVLGRYFAEKSGEQDVGRVLPAEYLFFSGDGRHNHFRTKYKGGDIYNWYLEDPYQTKGGSV